MPAGTNTFFQKLTKINFTVLNKSSNRKIHIFNYPLMPGQTRDLFYIPGVSEDDIRNSLVKGELAAFIRNGTVSIVSSSIDLSQYDPSQAAFITSAVDTTTTNSSPNYAAQTIWYIDGQNVSKNASDLNDGLTATTPLATDQQRAARVGANVVNVTMTVNLLSALASTDFITEPYVGATGLFSVSGQAGATVLHTGSVTAYAGQTGNTPCELTDSAVNWSTAGAGGTSLIGNRLRITSGARAGAKCWLLHDLGSGLAMVTDPENYFIPFNYQASSVTPTAGDPYVIESLPTIPTITSPYGYFDASSRYTYDAVAFSGNCFSQPTNAGKDYVVRNYFGSLMGFLTPGTGIAQSCCWILPSNNYMTFGPGAITILIGCGLVTSGSVGALLIECGSELCACLTTVYDGPVYVGGTLGINSLYANNSTAFGGGLGVMNSVSDGVVVAPGGVLRAKSALWGSGNTGYGIRVQSLGQASYTTKPTLTGATNDTILGGTAYAYSSIPTINTTNNAALVLLA